MAPRKGIVKSGNAGNSSKASKPNDYTASHPASEAEKPLFPSGYKYPITLLHERCQKLKWEKPIVETRHHPQNGYSFVVTLRKMNKKTSQIDSIRMEPHPPYFRPTVLEARHWGATYALYRFCNETPTNRVLPPGPRDYWKELAAEHKKIPPHQKWMYEADPFSAHQVVLERQAKAVKKLDESAKTSQGSDGHSSGSYEFSQVPEVKMASSLRDQVENSIKIVFRIIDLSAFTDYPVSLKGISLYPEAVDTVPILLSEEGSSDIEKQLSLLGFTPIQARNAIAFLSLPSPLVSNLLGSLPPVQAAIEYLILHVPECDLPKRFLPANNSSNSFITSTHSGTTDLKKRWVEEKAVKEAGWPSHLVKECTSDLKMVECWDLLLVVLGRKLIGQDLDDTLPQRGLVEPFILDETEFEALGAHIEEPGHLVMPLFSAPITLHILISANDRFPRPGYTPAYLTSSSVAAYVRLHLLSKLLIAMYSQNFLEAGEGMCMGCMRVLEEQWAALEDNGFPNISTVMRHILPDTPPAFTSVVESMSGQGHYVDFSQKKGKNRKRQEDRSDEQVRQDFEAVLRNDQYATLLSHRQKLPAFKAKDKILSQLQKNRVIVVVGDTGCGKTTQLPQFILESLILSNQGSTASILVTQPRRISAISVAARVSQERLHDGSTGYVIRGESKRDHRTKLLFCTTGVVLRRLSLGDRLEDISHIIVDEVHERSIDGDFLLLELKELLKTHLKLKVILMSATISHETFVKYFDNAPLICIPGFAHPVKDNYLEDVVPLLDYRPQSTRSNRKENKEEQEVLISKYKSMGLDDASIAAVQTISGSNRIDYQLIAAVIRYIMASAKVRGGILIFLPGVNEIRECIASIRSIAPQALIDLLPLHANLTNDQQRRVFESTSKWKIIAATNVAETSITIEDVVYVIDTGKVKETQFDPETNVSRLIETWVTRAAAKQRRGRAGRTRSGVCYKLYTRKQEERMLEFPVPEILRVPLETISLTVKATKETDDVDVKEFLGRAIDPPQVAALDRAWSTLQDLGAIDSSGKLTPLGKHISMLPVDVRLAKMLVLGTVFQCLGPILTIAASLTSKPMFLIPVEKRDEATKARARFTMGESDLLTDMNAFDEITGLGVTKARCDESFISMGTLREIATRRQEFVALLADLGFIPLDSTPSTLSLNVNSKNHNLVKGVILGGLWPRVGRVHLPKSAIKFDQVQAGTVRRENIAKEYKIYDLKEGRVFLHPGSVLFGAAVWKSPFLVYFNKHETTKVFLRDATEVPLYALLLFGGTVAIDHIKGGITIGNQEGFIKLRAWPRIGILVNRLRRFLDAQLERCITEGTLLNTGQNNPVVDAMLALLSNDGLTG